MYQGSRIALASATRDREALQRKTAPEKMQAESRLSLTPNLSRRDALTSLQHHHGNRGAQHIIERLRQGAVRPSVERATIPRELPQGLRAGLETLSGMSLDDVRVHYNSDKPGYVQASAYTQGVDIHLAPGQERHLPHETWHVVQQKQGRVSPTLQAAGVPINDNPALEREADTMGRRALQGRGTSPQETGGQRALSASVHAEQTAGPGVVQRVMKKGDGWQASWLGSWRIPGTWSQDNLDDAFRQLKELHEKIGKWLKSPSRSPAQELTEIATTWEKWDKPLNWNDRSTCRSELEKVWTTIQEQKQAPNPSSTKDKGVPIPSGGASEQVGPDLKTSANVTLETRTAPQESQLIAPTTSDVPQEVVQPSRGAKRNKRNKRKKAERGEPEQVSPVNSTPTPISSATTETATPLPAEVTPLAKESATPIVELESKDDVPGPAPETSAVSTSSSADTTPPEKQALGFTVATANKNHAAVTEITKLMADIRIEQSKAKQDLEKQLRDALGDNKDNERARMRLIKQHAANLAPIGLSFERLTQHSSFKKILADHDLKLLDNGEIRTKPTPLPASTASSTPTKTKRGNPKARRKRENQEARKEEKQLIGTLYSGEEAFEPTPFVASSPSSGLKRDVYRKRGKPEGNANEYVKDDKGVFTRRYAYVEKNKYQFRDLINTGSIEGRFVTDPSKKNKPTYTTVGSGVRNQVPKLPEGKAFTNAYQLAYVHQELGSGPQQRGVSATSTPQHDVFSNQGVSFKSEDGVRFAIDLALIPPGSNVEPMVINHYSPAAQQKLQAVIGEYAIEKTDEDGNEYTRQFDHYQWSVRKNREIFLKDLRPEYLTAITLHKTNKAESRVSGFGGAELSKLGESVGVSTYNKGFQDGIANRPDATTHLRVEQQGYYKEGRNDAAEYLKGYEQGKQAKNLKGGWPEANKQLSQTDKDKPRLVQGFWDGYYERPKRAY
jgi:hypothetical protein